MILSILICTLPERERHFRILLASLQTQIMNLDAGADVEIEKDLRGRDTPTGIKRNDLISRAHGEWVVFIDDDDKVPEYYVFELLEALKKNPDCVTFRGYMTTDGAKKENFILNLGSDYRVIKHPITRENVYHRWPNHITPIRKSIAQKVLFEPIWFAEDFKWSSIINDAKEINGVLTTGPNPLIKTEVFIDKDMYHYDLKTNK